MNPEATTSLAATCGSLISYLSEKGRAGEAPQWKISAPSDSSNHTKPDRGNLWSSLAPSTVWKNLRKQFRGEAREGITSTPSSIGSKESLESYLCIPDPHSDSKTPVLTTYVSLSKDDTDPAEWAASCTKTLNEKYVEVGRGGWV